MQADSDGDLTYGYPHSRQLCIAEPNAAGKGRYEQRDLTVHWNAIYWLLLINLDKKKYVAKLGNEVANHEPKERVVWSRGHVVIIAIF